MLDILGHANIAVTQNFMERASGCDPPRLSKTALGSGLLSADRQRARHVCMIPGVSVMQL